MKDSLHGGNPFRVFAERIAGVHIAIDPGEIAAGNIDANPVPLFEHITGS